MATITDITGDYPVLKMHGCGNDFIVLYDCDERLTREQAAALCRLHFGVGADGLIAVVRSRVKDAPFRMKFFNPDGTLAEMCGNGIRCFAKYLVDQRLVARGGAVPVDTDAGLLVPEVLSGDEKASVVKVNMNRPVLHDPVQVTLRPGGQGVVRGRVLDFDFIYVGMGNPHAVIFIDRPEKLVREFGPAVSEYSSVFPEKTNVEFVRVDGRSEVTMRVWERGVGETLACGTGACASLVAARLTGAVNQEAVVHLPGGELTIAWEGPDEPVYMTGGAETVFAIAPASLDRYLFAR